MYTNTHTHNKLITIAVTYNDDVQSARYVRHRLDGYLA